MTPTIISHIVILLLTRKGEYIMELTLKLTALEHNCLIVAIQHLKEETEDLISENDPETYDECQERLKAIKKVEASLLKDFDKSY